MQSRRFLYARGPSSKAHAALRRVLEQRSRFVKKHASCYVKKNPSYTLEDLRPAGRYLVGFGAFSILFCSLLAVRLLLCSAIRDMRGKAALRIACLL